VGYKLKEALFRVRCREPGCPFVSDFSVKENLQGATEADVESEAWKLAKDLGITRHDAIHGKRHPMINPDVHKIRSSYELIGAPSPRPGYAGTGRHRLLSPSRHRA